MNPIKLNDAYGDYLLALEAEGKSKNYLYLQSLTRLYWLTRWPDDYLGHITTGHWREWLIWLISNDGPSGGLGSSSRAIHDRNLRAFFNWCEREEYLEYRKGPQHKVKKPAVEEKQPDVLTSDEAALLLRRVKNSGEPNAFRDYCIHLALSVTLCRVGELENWNWSDVFLNERHVKVYGEKSKRERLVPLSPELCRALIKYKRQYRKALEGERAVFTNDEGRRLQRQGIQTMVRRDVTEFIRRPIKGIGPHLWRHTGATLYFTQPGLKDADVQNMLGHSNPQTTARYRHSNGVNNVKAFKAFPMDELARRPARPAKIGDASAVADEEADE